MALFAYRILPPRAEFWDTIEPGNVALMVRYLEHLRRLRRDGRVRFVGRRSGAPGASPELAAELGGYGLVLIEAEDEAHAKIMARSDPAVSEGLVRLEPHPFVVMRHSVTASPQHGKVPA